MNKKIEDGKMFYEEAKELHKQNKTTSAIEKINKSIEFFESEKDLEGLGLAILYKGMILHETGQGLEESTELFKKALKISTDNHFVHMTADALYNLAWTYRDMGKFDLALQYAKDNYDHWTYYSDDIKIAWAYVTFGWIRTGMEEFDVAENHFKRAISIFKKFGNDRRAIAFANRFLAMTLQKKGDSKQALKYFKKCARYFEKSNEWQYAIALSKMGEIYEEIEDFDLAIEYYVKTLDITQKIEKVNASVNLLDQLIRLSLRQEDKEQAKKYLLILKEIAEENKNEEFEEKYKQVAKLL